MVVGALRLTFRLSGIASLKAKRSIVRGLLERLRHKFHVAAAEVSANDDLSRFVIGLSSVANQEPFVNEVLDKVTDAAVSITAGRAELVDQELELLHYGETMGVE